MSKNMTGKWALFIIAFIVSCLIWYMVITNDDPRINISLGNIEVELLNGDQLHEKGIAYYVEENASVEVTVNVIQERGWLIKANDIRLTADLSAIEESESVLPITAEVVNNQITIGGNYKLSEGRIKVRTEKLVEKEIPVSIYTEGAPEDNCSIGNPVPEQEQVTIQIPESLEDLVVSAEATVDISGRSADYDGEVTLLFFDGDRNQVDCDAQQIFPETETMQVHIPIGLEKELEIGTLVGRGVCKDRYRCTSITADKDSVTVLGTEEALEDLERISIPSSEIDLTDQSESFELEFNLEDYLPEGVIVYDPEDAVLTVSVTIQKLERKTYSLSASDIEIKNLSSSLQSTISASQIQVVIEALPEELEVLEEDQIHMSVDLKDYTAGTYKVDVDFTFDVDNETDYEVVSSKQAAIILKES